MKVLIIGAGSVGVHTALLFIQEGHKVRIVDKVFITGSLADQSEIKNIFSFLDISDYPSVSSLFESFKPDAVIHTAGVMDSKVNTEAVPSLQVNIVDSLNVFDECERNSVSKILFTSSLAVYDFNNQNEKFDESSPKTYTNMYGLGKLICESYLKKIMSRSNTKTITLRFCGIYGDGDYIGGAWMGKYLNMIIDEIINSSSGKIVNLEEDVIGSNEFLYIEDAAKSLFHFSLNASEGVFNISPGNITCFNDLVSALQKIRNDIVVNGVPMTKESSVLDRKKPLCTSLAEECGFYCDYSSFEKGLLKYLLKYDALNEG